MIIHLEILINTDEGTATITNGTAIGMGRISQVAEQQAKYELVKMLIEDYGKIVAALAARNLLDPDSFTDIETLEESIVASGLLERIMERVGGLKQWIERGKHPEELEDVGMFNAFAESCERDRMRAAVGDLAQSLADILSQPPHVNGYGSGTDTPTPEEVARLRAIFTKHPDGGN